MAVLDRFHLHFFPNFCVFLLLLGQGLCLIVSIPDLCSLSYSHFQSPVPVSQGALDGSVSRS